MRAPVNRIIPFSAVDGPGNRTAVFLQGCNFNCKYCHNPETRKLCIHCGDCVEGCPGGALYFSDSPFPSASRPFPGEEKQESALAAPALSSGPFWGEEKREGISEERERESPHSGRWVLFSPEKCIGCDRCIRICRHDASPRIRWMSPEELLRELSKNRPFIRGVTVSGGECTLYPAFLRELAALLLSEGLELLLDSNGSYDFSEDSAGLLPLLSGVMLDLKAWKIEEHERVTGTGNEEVLRNLRSLLQCGKLYELRTVVVPGLFDYEGCIRECARLLRPYPEVRYKIIAFRKNGVRAEYRDFESPTEEEMSRLLEIAKSEGAAKVLTL